MRAQLHWHSFLAGASRLLRFVLMAATIGSTNGVYCEVYRVSAS